MSETVLYQLTLSAEAEVIRGCCGKSHEFGPCPFANKEE